ncbi:MAG: MBL fold metallo-hydrolase [Rhizobiaceae bacterium]|nr:MBL fold metallo-hydrolase [Rhizobiaceae bacterium]
MASPKFRTDFDPAYGRAVELAPGVERLTAPNKSAFTFHGTNTYIVGKNNVAVIDPGPLIDDHFEAIMRAVKGRSVTHIIITHTHVDHSPLAARLKEQTGASSWGEGPHRAARDLHIGETNVLDASGDKDFVPDHAVTHGQVIEGDGWALETLLTPGHTMNHACFALVGTPYMFSGDHVMGWATSIVAPPDGAMSDYMASLEIMIGRDESVYFPGHGGRLEKAREFSRALRAHRKMRETAILSRIRKGDRTIPQIVAVIYKETDPRLHGAAGLSVLAHIEDLMAKGFISGNGPASITGQYWPA